MRPFVTLSAALLSLFLFLPAHAKGTAAPGASEAGEAPPKVHEFLTLMDDPQVRAWLMKEISVPPASAPAAQATPEGESGDLGGLSQRVELIRAHFAGLAATIPTLPQQIDTGRERLAGEFEQHAVLRILALLALFIGLGWGVEWLFGRATSQFRERANTAKLDTVGQRLLAVGARLGLGIGHVLAFALGSIVVFLAFRWPPLLKQIILGYLIAVLILRFTIVIGRFLLAPGVEGSEDLARFRVIPMSTPAARYWFKRVALIIGWFAFGWITVIELSQIGFSREACQLLAYALGLVLLALAIESVWGAPAEATADGMETPEFQRSRRTRAIWLSLYFVALWLLWVAGAMAMFWVVALAGGLPAALNLTERAVNHLLRPPGTQEAKAGAPSLAAVFLERGLRALLFIGALLWLAHVWSVDVSDIATQDTRLTRIVRAVLTAIIVLLAADFVWNVAKSLIDTKVEEAKSGGEVDVEEERKRARLRTLLPILRNMLFVFIFVLAGLMGLASLGVEIGPLIASAGVIGVAIGFGAQTIVRDIISGMFYLFDDAFRVGEYIQSGNYRGVVEGFSLRSVKLRHQNGPLYTVPFGVLGAVQNQSRDWAVEKLTIGVTYDTDLEKARKIIKKIGQELAQDPELAAGTMEPLKMQGVQAFGDFAIQLRLKMKTRPGDVQFMARRRALAMIKKAFDANGINFAYPTVQVAGAVPPAGNEAVSAAVAQKGLELVKPTASG
jgi:moderate conductance mechanosensitive channel